MKKSKFYFNVFAIAILPSLFLGCSSEDDTGETEPIQERIKVTMNVPAEGDVDWSNVEMVWNEEFDGSKELDDIWVFETRNISNPDISDQLQDYQRDNVKMNGGTLKIFAMKKDGVYTSARISGKYAYKYGRIEIGAKLPEQEKKGIWAKLALIGDNVNTVPWPKAGEIDILEYFSFMPNQSFINVHSGYNNAQNGTLLSANHHLESIEEDFHAYGILWTNNYMKFYIDDPNNIIYTVNRPSSPTEENWPFDKHFYLLIDLVVGGRYAGAEGVDDSLFPAVMEIDYIRVYHPD